MSNHASLVPTFGVELNKPALQRVLTRLPELINKTRAFDRQNSQTTLGMMTLTMLNGQSPHRMVRQVLAEIERRRLALSEAQVSHAELQEEIAALTDEAASSLRDAKLRHKTNNLALMESKINGAVKDIAVLIDAFDNVVATHNIDGGDEAAFEEAEKRHHVRRAFELLYRNIIERGRPAESAIEYLTQFGVHVQIAAAEVTGYITFTEQRIAQGERMTAADLESFLDQMADKYVHCSDEAATRMFGKAEFASKDYMMRGDF